MDDRVAGDIDDADDTGFRMIGRVAAGSTGGGRVGTLTEEHKT